MDELIQCGRCHSELLDTYFSKNRKGVLNKCCQSCLERFKCGLCDYKSNNNSNLLQHIKQVHDKIRDIDCGLCEFKCSKNSTMKTHIKQVHDKIRDINCGLCEFKCSTNSTLKRHIKMVHDHIKDFNCGVCEYKCSVNSALKIHIKAVHDRIKDVNCSLCEYKCSNSSGLKKHIQLHTETKDFNCSLCSYKCSRHGCLKRHTKTCTGELNCSSGEFEIMKVLDKLQIKYVYDETYDGLKDKGYLRWDFKLVTEKPTFIEYDGEFHYFPIRKGGMSEEDAKSNLEATKIRDKIKDDYCLENEYSLLRIPYWDKNNIDKLVTEFAQGIM